jgi:hypothetical protein
MPELLSPPSDKASVTPVKRWPLVDTRGLESSSPHSARDCPECQAVEGMKLQNVARTAPVNIPLLYICHTCGTMLTIPPPYFVTE